MHLPVLECTVQEIAPIKKKLVFDDSTSEIDIDSSEADCSDVEVEKDDELGNTCEARINKMRNSSIRKKAPRRNRKSKKQQVYFLFKKCWKPTNFIVRRFHHQRASGLLMIPHLS